MEKFELVITALQQRIGELVSNYETQIAFLRADITQLAEQDKEKQKTIDEYSEILKQKFDNEELLVNEVDTLKYQIKILEEERAHDSIKKNNSKTTK